MIFSHKLIHYLPQPLYRVKIGAVWRQPVEFYIHHYHPPRPVPIPQGDSLRRQDNIHILRYWIHFPDGDKKLTDTQAVDCVILSNHRTAEVVQVQGSHDVQAGTTARGFHYVSFLSGSEQCSSGMEKVIRCSLSQC